MTIVGRGSVRPESSLPIEAMSQTVGRLRDLGMPGPEIDEILRTDDPRLIQRHLELHRERLEEWLGEQRATLADIEALLMGR